MHLRSLVPVASPPPSCACGLTACGSSTDTSARPSRGTAVQLVEPGNLTVCSDIPYPPFEDFDDRPVHRLRRRPRQRDRRRPRPRARGPGLRLRRPAVRPGAQLRPVRHGGQRDDDHRGRARRTSTSPTATTTPSSRSWSRRLRHRLDRRPRRQEGRCPAGHDRQDLHRGERRRAPRSSASRATPRCSPRSRPARSTRCSRTSRSTSTTPRTGDFEVVEKYGTGEAVRLRRRGGQHRASSTRSTSSYRRCATAARTTSSTTSTSRPS